MRTNILPAFHMQRAARLLQAGLCGSQFSIVANAPSAAENFADLLRSEPKRKTLALDGAADQLWAAGFAPDVISGDFDSIDRRLWSKIDANFDWSAFTENKYGILNMAYKSTLLLYTPDQNYTDLEKAIQLCDQFGSKDVLILNATGGRMDHTLGNIGALRKYHQINRRLRLQTEIQTLELFNATVTGPIKLQLAGELGAYCGLIAMPTSTVSSHGLVYDMQHYELEFGRRESTCNALATELVEIIIEQGEALLIYPKASKLSWHLLADCTDNIISRPRC